MDKRTCSEPECVKTLVARGYCRYHYRAYGYDKAYNRPLLRTANCKACGMEFSRTGTSAARMNSCSDPCSAILAGQAAAGRRVNFPACKVYPRNCEYCTKPFIARHSATTACSEYCKVERAAERAGCRNKPCPDCGAILVGNNPATYCESCRDVRLKASVKAGKQQRRARMRNLPREPIKVRDVYERDAWMCGLCCTAVDSTLTYPHRMSASLDHVIPIAKGGHHTMDNVQIAHLQCNMAKGARMTTDLALAVTA